MQQVDTTAPIQQTPPIAVDTAPQVGLHPYMEHQPSTNNTNINATPRVETSPTLQPVVPTTDSTFHPFYFYDTSFLAAGCWPLQWLVFNSQQPMFSFQ